MTIASIRFAVQLLMAAALSACGGSDDGTALTDTTDSVTATPASVTCDSRLFMTTLNAPTASQLAGYAKTYAGKVGAFDDDFNFVPSGDATLVFEADGSATFNGAAVELKSVCLDGSGGTSE